jgi:hypothetical protein
MSEKRLRAKRGELWVFKLLNGWLIDGMVGKIA